MGRQIISVVLAVALLSCIVHAQPKNESIGNPFIKRTFDVGKNARTTGIENLISKQEFVATGEEFILDLEIDGEKREVRSSACKLDSVEKKNGHLVLVFAEPTLGLRVAAHYTASPDDFYLRKWLDISCDKGEPVLVSVVVDSITIPDTKAAYVGGRGKPGFVGPFFIGLEHPAGCALKLGDGIELRHYPGKKLGKTPLHTQTAVLGAAQSEEAVRNSFLKYVARIRYDYPKPLRHHIVAKLFYVARRFDEKEYCDFADQFKEHLYKPTGLYFDTLNVWNYYLRGPGIFIWNEKKFPKGFHPIVEHLKPTDARIGFWFSLFCHEKCDTLWGHERGWEVQGDPKGDWAASRYCLAGPNYNKALRERLFELVNEYKPGFIHFDFNSFGCATPGHGHLPDGNHGWEANVDAEIAVLEDIRKIVPDIFLMMGCGSTSSPWWLKYYDVVFGMSADSGLCGMPDPIPKSNEITRRDITFKRRFTRSDPMFPAWGYWTHEPLLNRGEFSNRVVRRFKLSYLDKWEDNLVMDMHRGTRVWGMHFDPTLVSERGGNWDFLAHAIRYARKNNPIGINMKLLGGEPSMREAYGYAHWSNAGDRAVIAVRNPFIVPQKIDVKLDSSIGLKPTDQRLSIRTVYPYRHDSEKEYSYGDTISVSLERFELKVIEIAPKERLTPPLLPGKRYAVSMKDGRPLVFEEKVEPATVKMSDVAVRCEGLTLTGSAHVEVADCDAKLFILCEIDPPFPKFPEFAVTVNGKKAEGKLISYTETAYRVKGLKPTFAWYIVPLDSGRSRVEFTMKTADRFHEAKASLHLAATIPVESTVTDVAMAKHDFECQLLQSFERRGKDLKTVSSQVFTVTGTLPRMTATASSYATYNPKFVPQSVVDGHPGTFWVSVGTKNQWVEVDMGEEVEIEGVKVIWYSPWKVRRYKIQTWDGKTWIDCIAKEDQDAGTDSAGPHEIVDKFDAPIKVRKFRVVCVDVDKGSGNTSIREVIPLRVK